MAQTDELGSCRRCIGSLPLKQGLLLRVHLSELGLELLLRWLSELLLSELLLSELGLSELELLGVRQLLLLGWRSRPGHVEVISQRCSRERVLESVILIEVLVLERRVQVVYLNGQLPTAQLLGLGQVVVDPALGHLEVVGNAVAVRILDVGKPIEHCRQAVAVGDRAIIVVAAVSSIAAVAPIVAVASIVAVTSIASVHARHAEHSAAVHGWKSCHRREAA